MIKNEINNFGNGVIIMGYDSYIEIQKDEIAEVEQILKKIGFELAS